MPGSNHFLNGRNPDGARPSFRLHDYSLSAFSQNQIGTEVTACLCQLDAIALFSEVLSQKALEVGTAHSINVSHNIDASTVAANFASAQEEQQSSRQSQNHEPDSELHSYDRKHDRISILVCFETHHMPALESTLHEQSQLCKPAATVICRVER